MAMRPYIHTYMHTCTLMSVGPSSAVYIPGAIRVHQCCIKSHKNRGKVFKTPSPGADRGAATDAIGCGAAAV